MKKFLSVLMALICIGSAAAAVYYGTTYVKKEDAISEHMEEMDELRSLVIGTGPMATRAAVSTEGGMQQTGGNAHPAGTHERIYDENGRPIGTEGTVSSETLSDTREVPAETTVAPVGTGVAPVAEGTQPAGTQPVPQGSIDPLLRYIDFGRLKGINPAAERWVYIPDSTLDYPVMTEPRADSSYYLWRDIYQRESSIGTPLTPKGSGENGDAHLLIFGHAFTDNRDTMFYTLKKYYDKGYWSSHPYVYVYYEDRVEKWQPVWVVNVLEDDIVYDMPYELDSDEYANLLAYLEGKARQKADGLTISRNEICLVLSCCDRAWNWEGGRCILVCRLVETARFMQ